MSKSPSECDADIDCVGNYELGKTLGEGNFCTVKEALHVASGNKVAIKIIDKEKVVNNKDVVAMDTWYKHEYHAVLPDILYDVHRFADRTKPIKNGND
ncbi:unnamed protein product [Sphenostylis stenocarpa]|uniref:Protein kinase domain-containing protein n=1 Tax=Sphenostylis stenocarpa TaxID=92480 RepID=A0AA86S546_9FABA|nr:unnamed protein product [Sphenostylis stenocarpa]